ncbi:MAG: hypothetical protein II718_02675 [Clostridiales bacterium]|nr:hypothetical protein [Clostridiales bacterium]
MIDFSSKFIKAIIFTMILLFLGFLVLFMLSSSMIVSLLMLILPAALTILGIILVHVPFIKDHPWILLPIDVVIAIITAVIIYLI